MKFNIPIKVLIAFIGGFLIFVVTFFKFINSTVSDIVTNAVNTVSQGVLISLEKKLTNTPMTHWSEIIKNSEEDGIYVTSIGNLKFSSTQKDKLDAGEIISQSGTTYQFLNLVVAEITAYKKIGNTRYLLAYNFSNPTQSVNYYMMPAIKLIVEKILSKPENSWNEESIRLGKIYGFPVHVYSKMSALPNDIVNSLSTRNLVFEPNKNTTQIGIIYYAFSGGVLKIGPLKYPAITARITDVIDYFILAFFMLSLGLIILFSFLFVRNMKKIYRITNNFSHSNFDFQTKISPTSVLYDLYVNINSMGEKLQQLIQSHKQMCRFVAHETRTPLSTIQMAIDKIKKSKPLDSKLDEKLNSIQEDINDINTLVSTFLIFSQLQSREFILNKTKVNLIPWLEDLVSKYQLSQFTISFVTNNSEPIEINIDETLFKHAINNLIINATKFARKKIHISIATENDNIVIHVDDDGSGIPDELTEEIFSEYFCSVDAERYDKHIGLGLAIVKKVILLHNGIVKATRSPILKGARFTIAIPKETRTFKK